MDSNGKGHTPSYNASEHTQILYVVVFFAGIIAVNFFVRIVLVNYRKTREELSGERDLTDSQKEWLSIKTYILSLHPEKKKQVPRNLFRKLSYEVCTHRAYKVVQAITIVSFFIVSALYRADFEDGTKDLYWRGVGFYIAMALLDYLLNLTAFGYEPKHKYHLAFDTAVCLYLIVAYSLRQCGILEDQSNPSRIVSALVVFLLPARCFRCKCAFIQCSMRSPTLTRSPRPSP